MADQNNGSLKPRFDKVLNYGHVLQAVVLVVGIAIALVQFRDSVADLKFEQRLLDTRIENVLADVKRTQQEDQAFRTEVRSTLTILSNSVADLRVGVERASAGRGSSSR